MTDDFGVPEVAVPRQTSSRVAFIVGMIAMLCVGIVIGVVLEHVVFHPSWRDHGWSPRGGGAWFMRHGSGRPGPRLMDDHMARALSLTPAQRVQVDSIMSQSMRRMQQIQGQVRPQMRQIFTETHARIDSVLTPEQRERLQTMFPHREEPPGRDGPPEPR